MTVQIEAPPRALIRHAEVMREAIIGIESSKIELAEAERQLETVLARARLNAEGKNAQEREDRALEALLTNEAYTSILGAIAAIRAIRAEQEADLAYHKVLASWYVREASR